MSTNKTTYRIIDLTEGTVTECSTWKAVCHNARIALMQGKTIKLEASFPTREYGDEKPHLVTSEYAPDFWYE